MPEQSKPKRSAAAKKVAGKPPAKKKAVNKGGRPRFKPSEEQRQEVQRMKFAAAYPDDRIAAVLGIHVDTLRKYFPDELANSDARLLSNVAATLYAKAIGGDTTACIFIAKTRLGWRETARTELTGPDGVPLPGGLAALPPIPLIEFIDGDPEEDEPEAPQLAGAT